MGTSETDNSVNQQFSSFFSQNAHGFFPGSFSIFLTYYLCIMAFSNFFFLFSFPGVFSLFFLYVFLLLLIILIFWFLSSDSWEDEQISQPYLFSLLADLQIVHLLLTVYFISVAGTREQGTSQGTKHGHQTWSGWAEHFLLKSGGTGTMASVGR